MAGATGFVCDWLFVTAMREMKEVNNGRRNQTQRIMRRRRSKRPQAFFTCLLNDGLLAEAVRFVIFDCAAATISEVESIRLRKALLILVLYPLLGAALLLLILVAVLVGVVGFL